MKQGHRWFDLLLRAFPPAFRRRHGDDMRDAWAQALAYARAAGRMRTAGFLVRTAIDVVGAGIRERISGRGPPTDDDGAIRTLGTGRGAWFSILDVRLGARMLTKHPGLTIVSTFALAVGIPVGLAPAHFVDGIIAPLPVPEGDRIRSLRLWSPALGQTVESTYLDYQVWRSDLDAFAEVGAFRETVHNVEPGEGGGRLVRGADITASAFDILRTRPVLGRYFTVGDETPGGEPLVVIGHDLWESTYAADPGIIGRTIRLGSTPHTVIGVMPEGFFFPERQQIWTPLPVQTVANPEESPAVSIFGRLADGLDDGDAQAEFSIVGLRSGPPGRDARLRPEIGPFANVVLPGLSGGLRGAPEYLASQAVALFILLVACVNVGMLIFARTAARATELSVRTALGAGRSRIVAQVFTESLVLAVLAAAVGLGFMAVVLKSMWRVLPAEWPGLLPFWIDWSITPKTAAMAVGLAALSATVSGVLPALRFTSPSIQANLSGARTGAGLRFGGMSSVLIVLDVAVAVAAVGMVAMTSDLIRAGTGPRAADGIDAEEYLAARVRLVGENATAGQADPGRLALLQEELVRAIAEEPLVRNVAVANTLPRMQHSARLVEVEGVLPPDDRRGFNVRTAHVDVDFFHALDQPVLQGRGFSAGDGTGADRSAVIVNTSFVTNVLNGQNAVGRRIRYRPWGDGEPGPWKEIVGVVGHLGMRMATAERDDGVYEPFLPGELSTIRLAVHVENDPGAFGARLRELAAEVDPALGVTVVGPLDEVFEGDWYFLIALGFGFSLLVGVLLALAASGIYAIMSFAVSERTREIGIRTALGAGRVDIVRSIGQRALAQIGLGVLLGLPLALDGFNGTDQGYFAGAGWTVLAGLSILILVAATACTGPVLRALRVQPKEVLTGEG